MFQLYTMYLFVLADFWQFLTIFGSLQEGDTRSTLTISNAQREDAGNYTCKPSNAIASSIQVFVSEGMFRFTKEFCNRGRGLSTTLPLQTSLMFTTCLEIAWSQLWSSTYQEIYCKLKLLLRTNTLNDITAEPFSYVFCSWQL